MSTISHSNSNVAQLSVSAMPRSELNMLSRVVERAGSPIVIVPHDNPDVDAIISATTLHHLLSHHDIPSLVCLRTPPDEITTRIIEENNLFFPGSSVLIHKIPTSSPVILTDWFCIPDADGSLASRIIAIFDHHPTEKVIDVPIVYEKPYTSSTKLIYDLFAAKDGSIPLPLRNEIERNTLYTLFVDSNSMKSTRFNADDLPWMEEKAESLGEDWAHLVETGYCLNDMSAPIEELSRNGEKRYVLPNSKTARIAYIMVSGYDHSLDDDFAALTAESLQEGFDYAWFMICDLGRDETHIYRASRAGDVAGENGTWETYHANLSRAKDVYPMLERDNLE